VRVAGAVKRKEFIRDGVLLLEDLPSPGWIGRGAREEGHVTRSKPCGGGEKERDGALQAELVVKINELVFFYLGRRRTLPLK